MKKVVSILLAVLMAVTLTACGGGSGSASGSDGGVQTITIWHTFTEGQKDTLEQLAANFNKENEGKIEVVVQDQEYSGFDAKVYEAVAAGTGPDLVMGYTSIAQQYIGSSDEDTYVIDFDKYLSKDYSTLVNANIYAEATSFTDGKLHMLPMVTTGPVFFYNKTLFEKAGITEAPTTWEEVGEDSKLIHDKLGIVGFAADSTTDLFQSLICQSGIQYINTDTKTVEYLTDAFRPWLEWFQQGCQEGYFQIKPQSGDYNSNDINAGLLASYVGSSAGIPYLKLPEGDELGVVKLPQVANAKQQWAPAWDRGIIIFKSNEAKEAAAVKWAEYFVNEENNTTWCKVMNALSPYYATQKNADYTAYVESDLALAALSQQLDYAGTLPTVTGSATCRTELQALVEKTATGTDIDQAMATCKTNSDAALQDAQ